MEEAARTHRKPNEVISWKKESEERNQALIEAIAGLVIQGKPVNVSYDEMKDTFGDEIFGSLQPKRALDEIYNELKKLNISVHTGKTVKYQGKTKNGFCIIKHLPQSEQEEQVEI